MDEGSSKTITVLAELKNAITKEEEGWQRRQRRRKKDKEISVIDQDDSATLCQTGLCQAK